MSSSSSSVFAFSVLNLHHQASPVSRTPSMPGIDTSYIPPVPALIQDYRPYYHTPNDLSGNDTHTGCFASIHEYMCISKDTVVYSAFM